MYPGFRDTDVWTTGLRPDTQLPLVDEAGIAACTVATSSDPARFHGQTVGVASDVLAPDETVAVLQEVLDEKDGNNRNSEPLKMAYLSGTELEGLQQTSPVIVAAYYLTRDTVGLINIEAARKRHGVQMGTFRLFPSAHTFTFSQAY